MCSHAHMMQMNFFTQRLVEDRIDMGLTSTQMACGFSFLYHAFPRKQYILCSFVLFSLYPYITIMTVTSIRDFFCPWNNHTRLY